MYSVSRQVGLGVGAGPGGPAAAAQNPGSRMGWQARLLDFGQCRPDDEAAQFDLSNNGAISQLRVINAVGVSADQLHGWMEAIGRMNGLQHLAIDVSGFTEAQYCAIAACLGPFSPVKVLELSGGGTQRSLPFPLVQALLSCQPAPILHTEQGQRVEQPELLARDLPAPLPFQHHGETRVAERSMPASSREGHADGDLQDLTLLVNGHRMTLRMSQLSGAKELARRFAPRLLRLFACKPDGICSIEELMLLAAAAKQKFIKEDVLAFRRMQALLDSFEAALIGGCVCEMGGSGYYQLVSDSGRVSQNIGSTRQTGSKRTRSPEMSERDTQLLKIFTDSKLTFSNGKTLDVSTRTLTRSDGTKSEPLRPQVVLLILVCASWPGTVFRPSDMCDILSGQGGTNEQKIYRLNGAVSAARKELRVVFEFGPTRVGIRSDCLKASSRQRPQSMDVRGTDQLSPAHGHFELPLRERVSHERQRAAGQQKNRQSVTLPSVNPLTRRIGQYEMSLKGWTQGMQHRLLHLFAIKPDAVCSIVELMVFTRAKVRSRSLVELLRAKTFIHEFNCALTGGVVCACEEQPGYCQLVKSHSPEETARLLRSRGIDEMVDREWADSLESATLRFSNGCVLNALSGECTRGDEKLGTIRRQALLIMLILSSRLGEYFLCSDVANVLATGKNLNVSTVITKAVESVHKVMGGELIEINGSYIKLSKTCLTALALEPSTSTRQREALVVPDTQIRAPHLFSLSGSFPSGSSPAQESGDPK